MTRLLLSVLALLTLAGPAFAQLAPPKDPRAKAENDEGNRLYKLGEFKEAIKHYEAGARISDAPVFMYNLAQSHRQLGNYEKAIWFYQRFLSSGDVDPQVSMYVRNFIKVMKAKLAQEVRDTPPVEPEPHEHLKQPPNDDPPTIEIRATEKPGERWYRDPFGWSIAGVGLVTAGAGTWLLASAAGLRSDASHEPDAMQRESLREKADGRHTLGTVLAVVGAVAIVTGGVKLALRAGSRETGSTAWIAPTLGGVVVAGRF